MFSAEVFFCTREMIDAQVRCSARPGPRTVDELYARLLATPSTRLVVLGGEACFRLGRPVQTGWGWGTRLPVDRQPLLYGALPGPAVPSFRVALGEAGMREAVVREVMKLPEWTRDGNAPLVASAAPSDVSRVDSPRLSIVVVAYRSPHQAENTLYSLTARHQWNVREDDYEIVVVENRSDDMLGEARARRLGSNVRYIVRDEPGVSPAPALNFGVQHARGAAVGLMIDGARMVTPRVVEHALAALKTLERPLIAVPGYHLGPGRQHVTSRQGYDEAEERRLLDGVAWKESGYRLFEIACLDDATGSGFLSPLLESTCLFCPKACFLEVGGLDERFDLPGGGEVNHDLFARLCRLPDTRYVVLWGEGAFHQYHGGVSTGSMEDREAKLAQFRKQHDDIRGHRYATFEREPLLLGTCTGRAHERLIEAVQLGHVRYAMRRAEGLPEWPND